MATDKTLRLVLVTPETTLFDKTVEYLKFPLYDGQIGILPGRAPLVGRLGCGELQFEEAGQMHTYFIDGGFVQVKGSVISVLTNRAQPVSALDASKIQGELEATLAEKAHTDAEFDQKFAELDRARRKLALARKGR